MTDFTHIRELLAKATPGEWRATPCGLVLGPNEESIVPDEYGVTEVPDRELITALRNNAEAMLDRIERLEAGLRRIDAGLTKAIDMDNALSLDDMATQVRDLSRELLDNKAS